ncbi:Hypothetical predicted protein [Pelobates cultripes]|uniref:Uncharacterized protein n=1 Tax=Pelobates cultripes TaxID=61616 RepID=A0AAD1SA29_PELCU|nr:Hypothetical predicted protein [Pelobates cultripes]
MNRDSIYLQSLTMRPSVNCSQEPGIDGRSPCMKQDLENIDTEDPRPPPDHAPEWKVMQVKPHRTVHAPDEVLGGSTDTGLKTLLRSDGGPRTCSHPPHKTWTPEGREPKGRGLHEANKPDSKLPPKHSMQWSVAQHDTLHWNVECGKWG